jgi:flagellar motor switch protein FliN/FliY
MRFVASKQLRGELAFWMDSAAAPKLANILLGETPPTEPTLSNDQRDALAELFRQIAGTVAVALKPKLGGEVEFKLVGDLAADFPPAALADIRVSSPQTSPADLTLWVSTDLASSLVPLPPPTAPSAKRAEADRAIQDLTPLREPNLDLLMDVELAATLRFGGRLMLLRDVLELGPGAVVELDRQVDEPVELLVGGKVIAWGEVVIVEGNYGLRVTEMASAQERIESLRS